jgi:hypothetical protein
LVSTSATFHAELHPPVGVGLAEHGPRVVAGLEKARDDHERDFGDPGCGPARSR